MYGSKLSDVETSDKQPTQVHVDETFYIIQTWQTHIITSSDILSEAVQ
jgi:hypothetical protein